MYIYNKMADTTAVCGMCLIGIWVGYIAYNNMTHENTATTRKSKMQLTANRIDKQFDKMHKVGNTIQKHNSDAPTNSRYNYNRRRKPLFTNWF